MGCNTVVRRSLFFLPQSIQRGAAAIVIACYMSEARTTFKSMRGFVLRFPGAVFLDERPRDQRTSVSGSALCDGGAVVIPNRRHIRSCKQLGELIEEHSSNPWQLSKRTAARRLMLARNPAYVASTKNRTLRTALRRALALKPFAQLA